jgi:hypothetical protein
MRSLLAPLSPNEEITLRRVALAVGGERLPKDDMRRLRHLRLVEEIRGSLRLTASGRQRYASLEKRPLLASDRSLSGEIDRILAKYHQQPDAGANS